MWPRDPVEGNWRRELQYEDIVAFASSLIQDKKTEAFSEISRSGELQLNVNYIEVLNYCSVTPSLSLAEESAPMPT